MVDPMVRRKYHRLLRQQQSIATHGLLEDAMTVLMLDLFSITVLDLRAAQSHRLHLQLHRAAITLRPELFQHQCLGIDELEPDAMSVDCDRMETPGLKAPRQRIDDVFG